MYVEQTNPNKYAIHSLSKDDLLIIAEALETVCTFKYSNKDNFKRIKAANINSAIKKEIQTKNQWR